jgi:hypothetical protein
LAYAILTAVIFHNLPEIVCFCTFLVNSTTTGIFGLIIKIPVVKELGKEMNKPNISGISRKIAVMKIP